MFDKLFEVAPDIESVYDFDLGAHTSFKAGGKARLAVFPKTIEELKTVLHALEDEKYVVLGSGSNVLVSDKGFDGVVVFTKNLSKIKIVGNILICECGVKNSAAVRSCVENSLSGLEFAVDIPGTIGGLVAMNAGCYNKSCEDSVCYVVAQDGVYNKAKCEFGYRKSRFLAGETVYLAAFKLKNAEEDVINYKLCRFKNSRKAAQPVGNSCGSVFLNEGFFAGKIIDQAGLKGFALGGAEVSKTHANFIISHGKRAQDIFDLITYIKKKVFIEAGVELHEELKYVGDFDDFNC